MGNECSAKTVSPLLTQLFRYDCYHIQRAVHRLQQESKGAAIVSTATFVQHCGLSCSVGGHVAKSLDRDGGGGQINWRQALSAVLLCVKGPTRQKSPVFREVFELEDEKGIHRDAFKEAVQLSLEALERLPVCSRNPCVLFPSIDSASELVTASLFRHQELTAGISRITPHDLQIWAEQHPHLASPLLHAITSSSSRSYTPSGGNSSTVTSSDQSSSSASISTTRWRHPRQEGVMSGNDGGTGTSWPSSRSKHAMCVYGDVVYLHGGKAGNVACRDLWRWTIGGAEWERVRDRGERPANLQGHSILPYKGKLFVFGGNFGYGANDVPLWILDIGSLVWSRPSAAVSAGDVPCSRRNHTAVLYRQRMLVYGGFIDLKGSTPQLWSLDLEENEWRLCYPLGSATGGEGGPGARHSHSAVVHQGALWITGGMTDLHPRDDMWKWDIASSTWQRIRGRCPALSGHSASVIGPGLMMLYGGTTGAQPQTDLWLFTFDSHTWSRVTPSTLLTPTPRTEHCSLVLSPFLLASLAPPAASSRCASMPALKAPRGAEANDLPLPDHQPRPSSSPACHSTEEAEKSAAARFNNRIEPQLLEMREMRSEAESGRSRRYEKYNGNVSSTQHRVKENSTEGEGMAQRRRSRDRKRDDSLGRTLATSRLHQNGNAPRESYEMTVIGAKSMKHVVNSITTFQNPEFEGSLEEVVDYGRGAGGSSARGKAEAMMLCRGVDTEDSIRGKVGTMDGKKRCMRQTSSCESITVGYTPPDGAPLIHMRSNTLGNLSMDSSAGFSNPNFVDSASMYSRHNSHEDQVNLPIKRHRSDTEFSDEFVQYRQNGKAPHISDHISSGSIDSLLDGFGGVTFAQKAMTSARTRYPSRSKSTDDLILEDIEDCDMENEQCSVEDERGELSVQSELSLQHSTVQSDSSTHLITDFPPQDSYSKTSFRSQNWIRAFPNKQVEVDQSEASEQMPKSNPRHAPRKIVTPAVQSKVVAPSVRSKVATTPPLPTTQKCQLYVFGGKELGTSSLCPLPLPVWCLELTL